MLCFCKIKCCLIQVSGVLGPKTFIAVAVSGTNTPYYKKADAEKVLRALRSIGHDQPRVLLFQMVQVLLNVARCRRHPVVYKTVYAKVSNTHPMFFLARIR